MRQRAAPQQRFLSSPGCPRLRSRDQSAGAGLLLCGSASHVPASVSVCPWLQVMAALFPTGPEGDACAACLPLQPHYQLCPFRAQALVLCGASLCPVCRGQMSCLWQCAPGVPPQPCTSALWCLESLIMASVGYGSSSQLSPGESGAPVAVPRHGGVGGVWTTGRTLQVFGGTTVGPVHLEWSSAEWFSPGPCRGARVGAVA